MPLKDYEKIDSEIIKIYDDFKSRTCKKCKHNKKCAMQHSWNLVVYEHGESRRWALFFIIWMQ